jgi:uncharacterized membrane protein YbhN (UPF0104 family)
LLMAFGVRMSGLRAVTVTLSRSAIAVALPAGSAVSAGFAFQQYRHRGASRATASTVTILSALASAGGLALLYLGGLTPVGATWLTGWMAWVRRALHPVGAAVRGARAVPPKHWIFTLAFAVTNWLLDLVCLIAVARACHLDLGYPHLAAAYLAVQIVRQIPATPGGIGLIETSLLAGLVSAGASQAPAAAVVLGYRLLSCWLIIPIGLTTWLGLRLPRDAQLGEATPLSADRPPPAPDRGRRDVSGPRSLSLRRRAGRRLGRLRNSGPGGIRRPRRRQPH